MIVTVTMNPAIDKTVEINHLQVGSLNRIHKMVMDAGGKGINVSKTIQALMRESIATGFLAGNAGTFIEQSLKDASIQTDFVWVDGETRTNMKVLDQDGIVTEINEPGPEIGMAALEQLKEKLLHYGGEDTVMVFSGSVPFGVPKSIYGEMIDLVHRTKAKVILDADGALFEKALSKSPDAVKPNIYELAHYLNCSEKEIRTSLEKHVSSIKERFKIPNVVVSMGKEGAFFSLGEYEHFSKAFNVKTHSTVGAGDAMVAALAIAMEEHLTGEETSDLCMATATGAVMTEGTKPPTLDQVQMLLKQIERK